MENNVFRKGMVLAIICLFVGASVVQSISGDLEKTSSERNVKENEVTSSPLTANIVSPDDVVQYSEAVTLSSETSSIQEEELMDKLISVPLFFTENKGQFPEEVLFQAHVSGATAYLCRDSVVSVFSKEIEEESDEEHILDSIFLEDSKPSQMERLSVAAKFVDANTDAAIVGEDVLPHYNNYFIGNDLDKWYTNVPNYKSVWYKDIYPGIDLHYYGDAGSLKYDFIVSPGANPDVIGICYEGVEDVELTPSGDLQMQTRFGPVYEKMPVLYQEIDGAIQEVSGRYDLKKSCVFGFAVDGIYNPLYPLVIDPQLVYSTFLSGTNNDYGYYGGIAVDDSGCAYITGHTNSADFPTMNAYDDSLDSLWDCFVTKFSASGDSLIYSTFLGGTDGEDGSSIAVDDSGCAYVTGYTKSSDFPTVNAYDDSHDGIWNCFVTKFSASGNSLVYSTFLGGGAENGRGIAVDDSGCAYVTGYTISSDFPTKNAYDDSHNGDCDCFVTKFSAFGDSLIYSTHLGGRSTDRAWGIAVDGSGCAYITGHTKSSDFPTMNAYDDSLDGWDCLVTKFSASGDSLVYSTFLGGNSGDYGYGIVVDDDGCTYITGYTFSSDFPTVNAYDDSHNGGTDCFVTKLSTPGNSLVYSTYLGGTDYDTDYDFSFGIAVDDSGCAYVTGDTASADFPTMNAYDDSHNGSYDCFVTKFSASGDSLVYSTYLGGTSSENGCGIAVDGSGCAYVIGYTKSSDFPTKNAYDDSHNGGSDCFVTKFSWGYEPVINVEIDIKPDGYPNNINPKSKGKVPVAILTVDDFDASYINPDTVVFLDATPLKWAMEDVDDDSNMDMILHFKTQELDFSLLVDEGDEYPYAYLTGETTDGKAIEGKDTVRLVGPLFEILEQLLAHFPALERILQPILNILASL